MEATSGILDGLLALPQGGGAISGLGERFQPDLFRGSGSYAVPIRAPKGPADLAPELSLRYGTGHGNGPFGLGWTLAGLHTIRRRSDRGVPRYDANDQFVLSGAETLVEVGGGRFRPASDTRHQDIRRDGEGWLIRTKEGGRLTLGTTEASRQTGPFGVFAWHLDRIEDPCGNAVTFEYLRDGEALYLERVAWSVFALLFRWQPRPDPISDGRAGYAIRTELRCTAIERRCERLDQPLLARYELGYAAAEGAGLSLLSEIRLTGHGEDGPTEEAPVLRLGYTRHEPRAHRYHAAIGGRTAPPPLDRAGTTLVDMTGDGLPDVLETDGARHRLWPNLGGGAFGPPRTLAQAPAAMAVGEPGVSFADLDGDGTADLFRIDTRLGLAVANTAEGAWSDRPSFYRRQFAMRLSATDTRLVDLDGDGVVDLLQAGPDGFLVSYNEGAAGWSAPERIARVHDTALFPDVDLGRPETRIADLDGDGLADIAFVTSGRVEYWPSLGHGRFAPRIRMASAPVLPRHFDQARLFLVDLDGDGAADLVYVDHDRVLYWLNRSGEGWSDRHEIPFVPPPNLAAVHMADLLGTGRPGVLWSTTGRGRCEAGYRFLELGGPEKPYLLTEIDDGVGGTTRIRYTTTTAQRLAADEAGEPWESYLPFPVHVVEEIAREDAVTGRVHRLSFRYHRGVYDGREREFRGFARTEMTDHGDAQTPTLVQETRFHQQAHRSPRDEAGRPAAERARLRALSGSPLAVRSWEIGADGERIPHRTAELTWTARRELADGDRFVHFPHLERIVSRDHAEGAADRIQVAEYAHDAFGNLVRKREASRFADEPEDAALVREQRLAYVLNEAAWLVGLPAAIETRDGAGRLLSHTRHAYDGPAFEGLAEGQVERGLLRRTRELALADWALPEGYAAEIDPSWGLVHEGEGFYRTTVAYDHDTAGNVVAERNGLGDGASFVFDDDALFPQQVTDALGQVTTARFDPRTGQPLELVRADGTVVRYVYTPLGRLHAQFDTAGDGTVQLTNVFLADVGEPRATPPRPASVTSLKPLVAGRTLAEFPADVDAAGLADVAVARDYYDSDGNLLQRVGRGPDAADGGARWLVTKRRDHTARGEKAADHPNAFVAGLDFHTTPTGTPVRFFPGPSGQMRRIERPDGSRLLVRYLNRRIEKWDASTPGTAPPAVERFDARGNLVAVEEPLDGGTVVTRYEVDAFGRTRRVVDPDGRERVAYIHAGPGPAIEIRSADAGTRTHWRDAAGQLRRRADASGRRLALGYDALGRMTEARDEADPARPIRELVYDGAVLREARELDATTRYTYDAAGRIARRTTVLADGRDLTVEREHGLQGELRALVYPDGTRVTHGYDRTLSLRRLGGLVDDVDYDALGSPTEIRFTGGVRATYAYDAELHRLTEATLSDPGGDLVRRQTLGHDANGNLTSLREDLAGGETLARSFAYDRLYRLTEARVHAGDPAGEVRRTDVYAHSATGDLTRSDEAGLEAMVYGDAAHPGRLTEIRPRGAAAPVGLTYDDAGRVTAFGELVRIDYDPWDRVVGVEKADGTRVRFAYDHQGNRVWRRVENGGDVRETRWAENLYEIDDEGARLRFRLGRLLVAERLARAAGEETACLLTDRLGSVLAAASPTGAVLHQQAYSPFGQSLRPPGEHDAFTGVRGDDAIGLVQFGARWYAPALGRFISPDWFVLENPSQAVRTPQALNLYAYALNNPLAFRDPSGMWFGIDDLIVAAVGFVVGFVAGTIYGLATGQGWNSLLIGLEAGLLGAAGAWLAYATAGAALGLLGVAAGSGVGAGIAVGAAVVGGLNGVISGMTQIYDWKSPTGWLSFLTDSTWGLVGTTLGVLVHGVNLFYGNDRNYRSDLSRRQNRHVYDGGFGFGNFAFTQGNVVSNLNGRTGDLLDHETLHVWQSRLFGPVFQVTYVAWLVVGAVVGIVLAPFTDQDIGQDIMDVAYLNNPWETWAYDVGGTPGGGTLSWT